MEIRIYVANLAAYNAGHLVGDWIILPKREDDLKDAINGILAEWDDGLTPSEEIAIHDYEAPFKIHEYDSPYKINEYAERLAALDEDNAATIAAIIGNYSDVEEGLNILENGEYIVYSDCDDMGDVAYEIAESAGQIAQLDEMTINGIAASSYIDWDKVGGDLKINGTFLRVVDDSDGKYDVFYVEITR